MGDEMLGKWETNVWSFGEQNIGGNMPQPTINL